MNPKLNSCIDYLPLFYNLDDSALSNMGVSFFLFYYKPMAYPNRNNEELLFFLKYLSEYVNRKAADSCIFLNLSILLFLHTNSLINPDLGMLIYSSTNDLK